MPLTNIVPTSIAKRTLASVALGIGVVIVVITAISYYYVLSTVTDQSLQGLDKYISERVEREQTIFAIALANQESLKQELLFRLKEFGKTDPAKQFNRLFELFPDGTTRSRLKGFDGTREGFVFIDRKVVIDADIRRRVLTFLELSNEYGPAWHHLLQNVYFTTPENILVGYWPEVPTWAHDVDPELYMPDEEYVWVADMEHNPERKSVWTSLFYDTTGKIWMVSLETPVDLNGRQIATIGHDIPLEQLIDRTINNRLEGTHNFIISGDGHLIAHPEMMQELENKKDHLHLDDSDNEYLKDAFALIKKRGVNDKVIDFSAYDQYLAIAKIKGPDWFFVTVYPKKLVTGIAFRAAQFILFLGIASLL
ncbi:MAG: cache domain-containing protein, partial [Rhodospirillales bacterium]|nr:cache domain-containing protein [Rhodospirillales bacterium]